MTTKLLPSLQYRVKHLDNAAYHGGLFTAIPKLIVWHDTAGHSAREAMEWMNRANSDNPDSYHAIIDTDGTIYRTVEWLVKAYHAGRSWWPDPVVYDKRTPNKFETRSLNAYAWGVAFANPDTERASLTAKQVSSGWWLARVLMDKGHVSADANVAHREVAPGRKSDPNPLVLSMDWWRVALASDDAWSEQSLYYWYRQYHMTNHLPA